jgi:hypothetical protein
VDLHGWVVLVHIVAAFAFVLGHGVSMVVLFRIRHETDPARIGAQLDLSLSSMYLGFAALLVMLVSGIIAGFTGDLWGRGWIWASLGLLVAVTVYMGWRATGYFDALRHAIGTRGMHDKKGVEAPDAATSEDLSTLLTSSRPMEIAAVGGIGLLLIIYLMRVQPF